MKNKILILFLFCFIFLNKVVFAEILYNDVMTSELMPDFGGNHPPEEYRDHDLLVQKIKNDGYGYYCIKSDNLEDGKYYLIPFQNGHYVYFSEEYKYSGTTYYNFSCVKDNLGNIISNGCGGYEFYNDGSYKALTNRDFFGFTKKYEFMGTITEIYYPNGYTPPNDGVQSPYDSLSKDFIQNFEFDDYKAYFYTPSNNGTVNLHYKDKYFWKFNARLYVKFDGDPYITDKKILEMLISKLQLSSPFELYNPIGTYVQRPSLMNGFKAKAYIDFKIGFPSDFDFGEYELTASFPESGTSNSPDIKSATIKINLTNDGAKQEGVFDSNGNIETNGSANNSTDESISSFPTAPSDGSVGDWFNYIGELVIWLVTYPFKLLSDVFNVLGSYINSMMTELEETARAMNGLLTFIPQDILNVAYGFISFTLLYSVVRGVLKLIRG